MLDNVSSLQELAKADYANLVRPGGVNGSPF